MKCEVLNKLSAIGLVPVVAINDADKAVDLAKALIKGGLPCAEVTFRTAAGEEAIRRIAKECPQMIVGAGTVLTVEQAQRAIKAGAAFIVSPGFDRSVVQWCLDNKVPVCPGLNSASLVQEAISMGLEAVKLFPAEQCGGTGMLNALSGPFAQMKFMPTGGVNTKNLTDYAKCKNVFAIGGSWMVKADLINAEKWDEIIAICREAIKTLHGFTLKHIGINSSDEAEANTTADAFALFGFDKKVGNSSIFCDTAFEVMKKDYLGKKGHIAIGCNDIERALAYLSQYGYGINRDTLKEDKGKIKVVYLDKEIGGFAIHLVRN